LIAWVSFESFAEILAALQHLAICTPSLHQAALHCMQRPATTARAPA
jgi:hypothetical protein